MPNSKKTTRSAKRTPVRHNAAAKEVEKIVENVENRVETRASRKQAAAMRQQKIRNFGGQRTLGFHGASAAIARDVIKYATEPEAISPDGEAFLMIALNPCGAEEKPLAGDGRPTDGAVALSGLWPFRGVETIIPPWSAESSSSNSTQNWGLWLVSPPCFRICAILIASRTNQEPTDAQQAEIWRAYNDAEGIVYPKWANVDGEFYFSNVVYTAANLGYNAASGQSTIFSQGRMIGDGIVLMHNTPTLWDQGTIVSAQFPNDNVTLSTLTQRVAFTVTFDFGAPDTYPVPTHFQMQGANGDLVSSFATILLAQATTTGGNYQMTPTVAAPYTGTYYSKLDSGASWSHGTINYGTNIPLNVGVYKPATGAPKALFFMNNTGNTFDFEWNTTLVITGYAQVTATDPTGGTLLRATAWSAPNINTRSLVQVDPKFCAGLMKDQNGIYMVRHIAQPVFSLKDWINLAPIKALFKGDSEQTALTASGGEPDVIDLNMATYVIAVRGISYAAQPLLKMCRYYEGVTSVTDDNPLAVMMRPTPASDETATQTFFAFSKTAPHSYPPSMNFLGGLMAVISGAISLISPALKTVKTVSQAVTKAVGWAQENIMPVVDSVGNFMH